MVQPGNKRVQRAKSADGGKNNGGPMKSGLVPLTGKSVLLFNLPRQCCTHHKKAEAAVKKEEESGS
jgi:hypothetical protein